MTLALSGRAEEFCRGCLRHGVETPVERHLGHPLLYCTYHYWLARGGTPPVGYTLEEYAAASSLHGFRVSLPAEAKTRLMGRADVEPPARRSGKPYDAL